MLVEKILKPIIIKKPVSVTFLYDIENAETDDVVLGVNEKGELITAIKNGNSWIQTNYGLLVKKVKAWLYKYSTSIPISVLNSKIVVTGLQFLDDVDNNGISYPDSSLGGIKNASGISTQVKISLNLSFSINPLEITLGKNDEFVLYILKDSDTNSILKQKVHAFGDSGNLYKINMDLQHLIDLNNNAGFKVAIAFESKNRGGSYFSLYDFELDIVVEQW